MCLVCYNIMNLSNKGIDEAIMVVAPRPCATVCVSVLPAAPVGNPAPGKHLVHAQSAHSTTYPTNLDKDDVAILGWLGSVVEEDITSYQA